ncbi:MAG: hypothetical protein WC370_09610 [Dehalococcoidales bacterium]|jgi:hypothetical protein
MKKKLIIAFSIIIVLFLAGYFVAGYFLGNVPIASKLLGTNKAKDLGVVIRIDNAYGGLEKINFPLDPQAVEAVVNDPSSYTRLNTSLTSDEASSLLALGDIPGFPLRTTQIKFGPNGSVKASGVINTADLQEALRAGGASSDTIDKIMKYVKMAKYFNFYLEGNISIHNNQISGNLDSVKIGNIGLPGSLVDSIESGFASAVTGMLNDRGYYIRNLSISEDKIDLDMDRTLGGLEYWLKFVQY